MNSGFRMKIRPLNFLLILTLISFPFISGDCEKILLNQNNIPSEMLGNWSLIEQTGALQDICDGEKINFQSNGIAVLTCPGEFSVTRDFKVENYELTYKQTSVTYSIETLTYDTLYLLGNNVSRNLRYLKITADDSDLHFEKNIDSQNSSEIKK